MKSFNSWSVFFRFTRLPFLLAASGLSFFLACAEAPKPAAGSRASATSDGSNVAMGTGTVPELTQDASAAKTANGAAAQASNPADTAADSKAAAATGAGTPAKAAKAAAGSAKKGDANLISKVARWRAADEAAPFTSFSLSGSRENFVMDAEAASRQADPQFASVFSCPGHSFLVGLKSFYDDTAKDRFYQPICEFFEDGSGQAVKKVKSSCELKEASAPLADMDFTCPEGKLLSGLKTVFDAASGDRKFSFECCSAQHSSSKNIVFVELAAEGGKKQKFEADMTAREVRTLYADIDAFVSRFANIDMNSNLGYIDFVCKGADPTEKSAPPSVLYNIMSQYWTDTKDRVFSLKCGYIGIAK
ncbi:MAG: hypothetical protein KA436_08005 [Oligoflexales bacterium]|nr:hypothetical protein [Oligoflexales bacterium]